jgi:hypothetical protein
LAALRANELLGQGDAIGCSAWKRIVKAISESERTAQSGGERPN